jgi:hypothetical protein
MNQVYYNSNCTPDGNHSFGLPEIVIPYPKEKLTSRELDEYLEATLNENSDLVEELIQHVCQEGYVEIGVVEQDSEGRFIVRAEEIVYSGCRDLDFHSAFQVKLTLRKDNDGVHFFLSKNAVMSFDHWLGEEESGD